MITVNSVNLKRMGFKRFRIRLETKCLTLQVLWLRQILMEKKQLKLHILCMCYHLLIIHVCVSISFYLSCHVGFWDISLIEFSVLNAILSKKSIIRNTSYFGKKHETDFMMIVYLSVEWKETLREGVCYLST